MKTLVAAVQNANYRDVLQSLEDAFERYRKLDQAEVADFRGTWEAQLLLRAFLLLRKQGYHFGPPNDQEILDSLIAVLKRCPEVNHEGVQAGRPRSGKGAVRVHRRA